MVGLLLELGFDKEEIDSILSTIDITYENNIKNIVYMLKRYGCNISFIREIFKNRIDVFYKDKDVLQYKLEAILANGDIIEDIFLDIL